MSVLNFGVRSVFAQADHMRIVKRRRGVMLAKVRAGKPVVPRNAYGWQRASRPNWKRMGARNLPLGTRREDRE